jgi:hypothetical protein
MNRAGSGFRQQSYRALFGALCMLAGNAAPAAGGLQLSDYGTSGLHPQDNTYSTGLRPPHSRNSVEIAWSRAGSLSAFTQIERRFGVARHPALAGAVLEDMRVTRTGLRGRLGTLALEQQWVVRPLLHAHSPAFDPALRGVPGSHPVDELGRTMSWTSPRLGAWDVAAAYSEGPRNWLSAVPSERSIVGTLSYHRGGLTLSGASDGAREWNLFGRYAEGRNTWRLMLARAEGDDDPVLHFGFDHRYSRALTFFAEFHREDEGAYVTSLRRSHPGFNPVIRGGRGIMTGLRYDF